jgi:hypothetical protein
LDETDPARLEVRHHHALAHGTLPSPRDGDATKTETAHEPAAADVADGDAATQTAAVDGHGTSAQATTTATTAPTTTTTAAAL